MKKHDLLRTFYFCLIITAIIAAGFIYNNPKHWAGELYSTFIFSMCIGYSIHFLMEYFSHRVANLGKILRGLLYFFLFLFGGLVGSEVGIGILMLTFGYRFNLNDQVPLLSMNFVFSALFGTIAVIYFTLRAKVERMAAQLKEKELNEERLTRTKMEAELQALQAKINPHFLFNTLNSIASLISENPKAAESTVEKLSELFRYTLASAEKNSVSIAEELDIVRTYLEIEKVRFGERLQYEITCEDGVGNFLIPALIIEPLVENSIKHGIATEVHGGKIIVDVRTFEGACQISVIDNGKGMNDKGDGSGFGLRSVEERPLTPRTIGGRELVIVRPLIDITREETVDYCQRSGLEPRFDASNLELSPLRNKIRLKLLPMLERYNSNIADALLRLSASAADELDYLDEQVAKLWSRVVKREGDVVTLDKKRLRDVHPALKRHLLRACLEQLTGGLKDIESCHIEDMLSLMEKPSGRRIDLPYGLVFMVGYDAYWLGKEGDLPGPFSSLVGEYPLTIPGVTELPGWRVEAKIVPTLDRDDNPLVAFLDADATGKDLSVRTWKMGDCFKPLGMGCEKKLGKFMIDARIPRLWRHNIPVVASSSGIVWLVGYRLDERVKVTSETRRVLRLEFKRV